MKIVLAFLAGILTAVVVAYWLANLEYGETWEVQVEGLTARR